MTIPDPGRGDSPRPDEHGISSDSVSLQEGASRADEITEGHCAYCAASDGAPCRRSCPVVGGGGPWTCPTCGGVVSGPSCAACTLGLA